MLLVLVGGLGVWAATEAVEGHGPLASAKARHLRAMKDRVAQPATVDKVTLESFGARPANLPLADLVPLERHGVRVEGYVLHFGRSRDGDFHLELTPTASPAEMRGARYVVTEITPAWRKGSTGWTFERLAEALDPARGSAAAGARAPRRVRISGWLMYDFLYDALPAPAFDRAHRVSGWEVHPVTRIERWDDARQAFVELPR
jgi:hypothetical protein